MKFLSYSIRHRTHYRYAASVAVSHHLLCLRPRNLPRQRCLDYALQVEPGAETMTSRLDYFGNHCEFITVEGGHGELTVTATSRVAVAPQFPPEPSESPSWEVARALTLTDRSNPGIEALEFTYDSPLTPAVKGIADYARQSFRPNRPILEGAIDLTQRIFTEFKFDPSATDVSTPLAQVFSERSGVCQDFAHFQVACFRSLGLSARYVSGYLETDTPVGVPKMVGADASHAWVSFFCPRFGWIDLDPTNGCLPALRHLTVGWGRDYGDVCPMRGVIHGGGEHLLHVGVDVIAEEAVELASMDSAPPLDESQPQISPSPGFMSQSQSQSMGSQL